MDLTKNTFAFSIPVNSFQGFNSPLQKEHFNEYYLETSKYPKSTFTGKIIGLEQCDSSCDISVKAKGKLKIHGVTKVVTIPVQIQRKDSLIDASAEFDVLLRDYNISIPKILESKISPTISIKVKSSFVQKK